MGVETRVLERTDAFAVVEVPAWNVCKGSEVFFDQLIFNVSLIHHARRRDHQVAVCTADWASPVMCLLYLLVVRCSPISDTVKTKGMRTILKDSKAFVILQNFFEANYAAFVSFVFNLAVFAHKLFSLFVIL